MQKERVKFLQGLDSETIAATYSSPRRHRYPADHRKNLDLSKPDYHSGMSLNEH